MRRKNNGIIKYIIPVIFILIIILYFLFLIPSNIECGIAIEKKELKNHYRLKILYDSKTKWITVDKKSYIDSLAYSIKLRGIRTVYIKPLKVLSGKVYSKDNKTININDNIFHISPKITYYLKEDNRYKKVKQNYIIVGHSNYLFIADEENIIKAVIAVGAPTIENIRVGISNYNLSSYDHQNVIITSKEGLNIYSEDFNIDVKRKEIVKFSIFKNKIKIIIESPKNAYQKRMDTIITDKRVFVKSHDSPIIATSLQRNNGYTPEYYGNLEVFLYNNKLRIINEVNIEDYLKYVVPSEMPGFGGLEGYKVQTIAARTYALSEILGGRFSKYGFNIDDTTQSQVYNERPTNELCIQAVEETKGKVLAYDGAIIDAKYYSTSCGIGAPYNEIYPEGLKFNPKPYLDFNNYTNLNIKEITSDEDASKFFKDWTLTALDSNSPYFRWKFSLSYDELNKTINENIYKRFLKNPNSFKEKWIFNIYKDTKIGEEGIGKIKDIYISKRGRSGVAQEMIITTDKKQIKVIGASNIKALITPKDLVVETISGLKLKNISSLPSPFFIIDKITNDTGIKSITVFGGGYGHGVGMSQYAAMNLAKEGKNYEDILKLFYKNTQIKDYNEIIKSSMQ